MNNRMLKKQEKKRRKKIVEIFDLALQVNGSKQRNRENAKKLPTVFAYFYGHVDSLEIRIHERGYGTSDSYEEYEFYVDKKHSNGKRINECHKRLTEIRKSVERQL